MDWSLVGLSMQPSGFSSDLCKARGTGDREGGEGRNRTEERGVSRLGLEFGEERRWGFFWGEWS